MEERCKNCQYFEARGKMDSNTWGLCPKFGIGGKSENNNKNNVFRWWDDICKDFKVKTDSKTLQHSTQKAGN